MTTRTHTLAKLGGLLGLLAIVAVLVAPAGAAPNNVEYKLESGDVRIGTLDPLLLPQAGTGILGTWDDATGAIEGELTVGPIQLNLTQPAPVVANVTITPESTPNISGVIDPATGLGVIDTTLAVTIEIVSLSGNPVDPPIVCTLSPIEIEYEVEASTPPFDASNLPQELLLQATEFQVPPGECTDAAVTPLLNQLLGLPTANTSSQLIFEFGAPPPPDTLPEPTTTTGAPTTSTVAPATQPAQAVRAQPRVTG